jgi:hypothetical protein
MDQQFEETSYINVAVFWNGGDNIQMYPPKVGWGALTGLMWLRIGTGESGARVNVVMGFRVP